MIAFAGWETDWPFVAAPFVFYFFTVFWLLVMGDHEGETNPIRMFFRRISTSLEDVTGYPGWSMAGALSGLLVLAVAALGLYWDVAYHIDYGRDNQLMTPSHTMILLGLGGMVYAAVIAVIFATNDRTSVGFRFAGLQIPYSAVMLAVLGFGGVAAFPLDNLWHQAYGIDVTLWSPTHLQLVAGGGLGPIAVLLMLLEGRSQASPRGLGRLIEATTGGAVLVGLSTFQGEFDFGVPQFQAVYLPVLFALAMGFGFVLVRMALGRGGALSSLVAFVVLRSAVALLVGGGLNHTTPRFPLYLVGALCVEGVAFLLGTERTLRFGLVAGAAVGTIGLAGEMIWVDASGWFHVEASSLLVPAALLGAVAATAAAVLGAGLGRAWRRPGEEASSPMPLGALVAAGVAVVAVLAVPLPRNVGKVDAVIRLEPAGELAKVAVDVTPADAAENATAFGVMSWQGGGRVWAELERTGPGHYVSTKAVPVTGTWKSMVSLQRGDEVMAAPIYLPADAEIAASAVPALPERATPFVRNTDVLLREAKDGPAWPAALAYAGVALVAAVWIGMFAFTGHRLAGAEPSVPVGHPGSTGAGRVPVPGSPLEPVGGYRRSWATW
ncbi:MAG TPA: hypothetical protein VHM89_07620 [Acidimicrobiales bacterium]|nr:hypothetical protein [Acidimicrobiales bacterium]